MTERLSDLFRAACGAVDPLRTTSPFSGDLVTASRAIWDAGSDGERETALREWLIRHQPCLFGRIAAKNNLLSFCFISESDIERGDEFVFAKIQKCRLDWLTKAHAGDRHGFILLLASPALANAIPGDKLMNVALKLGTLYLEEEIRADAVHLEHVYMTIPAHPEPQIYRWPAGVNVFCAQGDGRWWCDHRMPGGLGFSVNSVGHMVKTAKWRSGFEKYAMELQIGIADGASGPRIDSLDRALELAMKTIANANESVSGKATWLEVRDDTDTTVVRGMEDESASIYGGYYHTDHTVPSCYFRPDVARPSAILAMSLDFTYLHKPDVDNIDSHRIGAGRRIKAEGSPGSERLLGRVAERSDPMLKRIRGLM